MDRQRLEAWLRDGGHTWRWNDSTDQTLYEAVEVTGQGLRWYRWSHVFRSDGIHGEHDVVHQSIPDFVREGPPRSVPEEIRQELDGYVARY